MCVRTMGYPQGEAEANPRTWGQPARSWNRSPARSTVTPRHPPSRGGSGSGLRVVREHYVAGLDVHTKNPRINLARHLGNVGVEALLDDLAVG